MPWSDPEDSVRWGGGPFLFLCLVIKVFYRGPYEPAYRSNWTQWVQLLLESGSIPEFLRKPIATCDFPGG